MTLVFISMGWEASDKRLRDSRRDTKRGGMTWAVCHCEHGCRQQGVYWCAIAHWQYLELFQQAVNCLRFRTALLLHNASIDQEAERRGIRISHSARTCRALHMPAPY